MIPRIVVNLQNFQPGLSNRECVVHYWSQYAPNVDHEMAKAVKKTLHWGDDLLDELYSFLGYMDPRSLTTQEVDYILSHHGYFKSLNCNGEKLYNLTCDDMQKCGYSKFQIATLVKFLTTILGETYYPWTLTNPRPNGKVECCFSAIDFMLKSTVGCVATSVIFLMGLILLPFTAPLKALSFCFTSQRRSSQIDFFTPCCTMVWFVAMIFLILAIAERSLVYAGVAVGLSFPYLVAYSFGAVYEKLSWGIQEKISRRFVPFVPCLGGIMISIPIMLIILSQTVFEGDDSIFYLMIGVLWITLGCVSGCLMAFHIVDTACFSPDVKFVRKDGMRVPVYDLHSGDEILAANGNWTKVIMIIIHERKGRKSYFYRLHLSSGDSLSISGLHYQPVLKNGEWKDVRGQAVDVGDVLGLQDGTLVSVNRIENFQEYGVNVICRDPYIIANGIKSTWDVAPTFPNIATNVVRRLLPIIPTSFDSMWQPLCNLYMGSSGIASKFTDGNAAF